MIASEFAASSFVSAVTVPVTSTPVEVVAGLALS